MSANLYPGIKSLHLVLDTPYDLIRTDDVRDDLVGIKVWYSTTQAFNPANSQGTLAFDGLSQSIIISDLEINTRYYVRYAFISAIDPTTFTISPELTAEVLDENVTVSGYLTNDPTAISTNADGSGGNFALTQGVFKVFNFSQDVTGAGPVYGIVPNTIFGGLVGSINPTTGVYSATALAEDAGNVTFYATYNNITITKVWNLLKTSAGSDAPSLRIKSTGNVFVFADENASVTSSGVSISTNLQNLTGIPAYSAQAYTRAGVLLGPIQFTTYPDGVSISINAAQFNPTVYNNTVGYVEVTSSLGAVSDSISLYRVNNGSEQITVEQSNQTHTITAFADGFVAEPDYAGSGTIIKVKQGNSYLPVDNNSPYITGSWRLINIDDVGIVADSTPSIGSDFINFDQHSAMTADAAYIDYQVVGTSTTGKAFSVVVRQSFSKSKAGVRGSSAPSVSLTASTQTFVVAKNTGTISPSTATFTASVVNVNSPVYAWTVDGVVQASTTSTLTVASFTGSPKLVKVVVTGADSVNVFDQATLFSLREGDDSLQAGLANENQTVACDPTGEPIAGQFPLSSQLVVVRGAVILASGVTYSKVSETGMSSTINASTGVISINSVSADFGSATYRATIGTVTLDKTFTFNKSKNGAAGAPGKTGEGVKQIYIRSELAPNPNPPPASENTPVGWSPTVAGAAGTGALWTSFGARPVDSTIYTWQVATRVQGEAGNPLRNASGFLYYSTPQPSAPGTPSASGFDFTTGSFSSITPGWATTFNVPSGTNTALWAVRYSVQEAVFGGTQLPVAISAPFTHQNFNGLVTFTNDYITAEDATTIANGRVNAAAPNYADKDLTNVTTIDGGKITTGSLNADKLEIGRVRTGDYIRMFDNRIIVYTGNMPRVIIGSLT